MRPICMLLRVAPAHARQLPLHATATVPYITATVSRQPARRQLARVLMSSSGNERQEAPSVEVRDNEGTVIHPGRWVREGLGGCVFVVLGFWGAIRLWTRRLFRMIRAHAALHVAVYAGHASHPPSGIISLSPCLYATVQAARAWQNEQALALRSGASTRYLISCRHAVLMPVCEGSVH